MKINDDNYDGKLIIDKKMFDDKMIYEFDVLFDRNGEKINGKIIRIIYEWFEDLQYKDKINISIGDEKISGDITKQKNSNLKKYSLINGKKSIWQCSISLGMGRSSNIL